MKNETINFKTDKETKQQAYALAFIIGIPVSNLLHAYLREFIASNEVYFSHAHAKKARTPEKIAMNLVAEDREKLRKILNAMHLKEAALKDLRP